MNIHQMRRLFFLAVTILVTTFSFAVSAFADTAEMYCTIHDSSRLNCQSVLI